MSGDCILIVDDERDVREVLKFCLEGEGIECLEAADGERALELVAREKPALILLDLMLPKVNGYDVAWLLKNDPAHKDVLLIMLTAKADPKDIELGSVDRGGRIHREAVQRRRSRRQSEGTPQSQVAGPPGSVRPRGPERRRLMARKRVLIIDDEPDVARAIKFALELEDIECLAAEDGTSGLDMAMHVMAPQAIGEFLSCLSRNGKDAL